MLQRSHPTWTIGKRKNLRANHQRCGNGERVLPYLPAQAFQQVKETKVKKVVLEPTEESELLERIRLTGEYEGQLNDELIKYAMLSVQVAIKEKPKMIHAHDWITFRAGRMIKSLLKKKLCLHVHSTEYDRNGSYAQPFILEEEQLVFSGL